MPRTPLLLVALALGAISAGALVACGSNDNATIPQANADVMLAALSQASAAEASEDCAAIQDAASSVADEAAANLPSDVDPQVRQAIIDGAEQLFQLSGSSGSCGDGGGSGKTTTKKKTTSTTSTTSTTDTSTTTQQTTAPDQPQNEGGNLGGGDSGGTPPDTGSGGTSG